MQPTEHMPNPALTESETALRQDVFTGSIMMLCEELAVHSITKPPRQYRDLCSNPEIPPECIYIKKATAFHRPDLVMLTWIGRFTYSAQAPLSHQESLSMRVHGSHQLETRIHRPAAATYTIPRTCSVENT